MPVDFQSRSGSDGGFLILNNDRSEPLGTEGIEIEIVVRIWLKSTRRRTRLMVVDAFR